MKESLEKIEQVVNRLDQDGILENLSGNCVLAADIFQSMLDAQGVKTRIVECE